MLPLAFIANQAKILNFCSFTASDCFLTNKKSLDKQLPTKKSVELLAKALNPCFYALRVLQAPTFWVEAQELLRIFTNLQLAHKAILFSFY